MDVQANVPGRLLAALVLLIPALLGFQVVYFSLFGGLLMLGAAFAAAVATGYARRDAMGVAVGCGVLVAAGGTLESTHPAAAVIAYACAASVAIRPSGRIAVGARVAGLLALFLLAGHLRTFGEVHAWGRVHGWWVLLFIPPVVAAVDAFAHSLDEASASEGAGSEQREPIAAKRSSAPASLTLVSFACLVVLLLPWILGFEYGNGRLRLGLLGLGLVSGATGAVRALKSVRTDPVRSAATIALSIVPMVILGWILFVLLAFALGGGFELG